MALNLYRRHGSKCAGRRILHEMTYEADVRGVRNTVWKAADSLVTKGPSQAG